MLEGSFAHVVTLLQPSQLALAQMLTKGYTPSAATSVSSAASSAPVSTQGTMTSSSAAAVSSPVAAAALSGHVQSSTPPKTAKVCLCFFYEYLFLLLYCPPFQLFNFETSLYYFMRIVTYFSFYSFISNTPFFCWSIDCFFLLMCKVAVI